jgi:hydrogenase maturation protease
VAQAVAQLLTASPAPGVEVLESTRGGLELLELLSGYDRAIIVDCVARDPAYPGRIHRLSLQDVADSPRLINPHEIGIAEVFLLAKELGIAMPPRVEIVGIEGAEVGTLTERLSPEVESVVTTLAREIHTSLLRPAPEMKMRG